MLLTFLILFKKNLFLEGLTVIFLLKKKTNLSIEIILQSLVVNQVYRALGAFNV